MSRLADPQSNASEIQRVIVGRIGWNAVAEVVQSRTPPDAEREREERGERETNRPFIFSLF